MIGGATLSIFNPYALYEYPGAGAGGVVQAGYSDTSGKTLVSAALVAGQKTGVFIALGQSQIGNFTGAAPYTPSSTLVHHLDPYSGNCYWLTGVMLGCSGAAQGNYLPRLGDKLITAGTFARVIFINVAIGGTTSLNWSSRGQQNHRLTVALALARKNGWPVSGILRDAGTSDYDLGTSQGNIETNMADEIASSRGVGYDGPWFLAQHTMLGNATSVAGQNAVANVAGSVFGAHLGPNLDSLTGVTNLSDGTHFTDTGGDNAATLWTAPLIAYGY